MEIEEQHVFRFIFPFLGDKATFNVVAEDQKQAAEKIKTWMQNTLIELSVSFPNEVPQTETTKASTPKSFEEESIAQLLAEIGKYIKLPEGVNRSHHVKELTSLELEPGNYPAIIEQLANLKTAYDTGKIKKAR